MVSRCHRVMKLSQIFCFFTATAPTEIYTLSLHDALPISGTARRAARRRAPGSSTTSSCPGCCWPCSRSSSRKGRTRSEEHTSELQSRRDLVCRLLLEKKKKIRQKRAAVNAHPSFLNLSAP